MIDWDAVSKELFAFFVELNEVDKDVHQDRTEIPELGLLTKIVRNTCFVVAVLNDYRKSPFVKINAVIDDDSYLDTIYDIHRTFLSGLHIYFEQALRDWTKRHGVTAKSSTTAIVNVAVARLKTPGERQAARDLLSAFEVVRNKVSHSDTTLTAGDIKRLNDGGFGDWIDSSRLKISFDKYPPVVKKLVKLFRDIDATAGRA